MRFVLLAVLLAVLLLGSLSRARAEDGAGDPPSTDDLQIFHLSDGAKLIGVYDEKTHILSTYNPDTMEKTGIRGLDPHDIASHRPLNPVAEPVATPVAAPTPSGPTGTHGDWLVDLSTASASASASGRPILIDFTGSDWCPVCIKLHDEIFATPDFKDWASRNVVLLVADFPNQATQNDAVRKQNLDLQAKYHVQGYPTVVVVDAAGTILGESGYVALSPKAWIADLCQRAHLTPH